MDIKFKFIEAIYLKTGIRITSKRDCKIISELIINEKIGYISVSTLYRIFILQDSNYKPFKNSFDILSKFCGFNSFDLFLNFSSSISLFNDSNFLNNTSNTLFRNLIRNSCFDSLIDIYENLDNENFKIKEYYGLISFNNFKETDSFNKFMMRFGHHKFVRNIIVESLYDPFHRIPGYTEGLKSYLKFTKKNSVNYFQDFIFCKTVLFRNSYFNNKSDTIIIGREIYELQIDITKIDMHIFPKTRYLAYKLWYLKIKNYNQIIFNDYLQYIYDWVKTNINESNNIEEYRIVYQTFYEVLENLKLINFIRDFDSIFYSKLIKFNIDFKQIKFYPNANGLLNFTN